MEGNSSLQVNFNVSQFIKEVGLRRELYDPGCAGYGDREAKMRSWSEVLEACVPSWEASGTKQELLLFLQKKWKNIRDTYVRDNRRISKLDKQEAFRKKKNYIHYRELRFLDSITSRGGTKAGRGQHDVAEVRIQVMDSIWDVEGRTEFHTPRKRVQGGKKAPNPAPEPPQAKEQPPEAFEPPAEPHSDPAHDSDRLFLLSLLSDLKRVPEVLKLEAKCELLQVIRRYITYTSPSPQRGLAPALAPALAPPYKSSPPDSEEDSD